MPGKGLGSKGKAKAKRTRDDSTSSDGEPLLLTVQTKKAKKTKKTPPAPLPDLGDSSGQEEEAEDSSARMPPPPPPAALEETQSSQLEALSQASQVSSEGKRLCVNLTEEQEEEIVEWLKSHPMLYDKSDKNYRCDIVFIYFYSFSVP